MLPDPKILVVDDEEANVVLLEFLLQRNGYARIKTLTDSRKVAAAAAEFLPDLVLLDLSMPHIDGFAVMAQLRAAQRPGDFLPILILTADITLQTKRRALAGGANDFVTKPFENEEVLLRCKNLLQTRGLHLATQDQNRVLEEKVRQRTRDLEQTMAELKASQRQSVQQERLRALGEMSAGVAHDFNNQLTVILGYTDLLLLNNAQMLSNKILAAQYLQNVNAAARESSAVVSRLRDFSRRREAGDIFLAVDLQKLVKEAAVLTQPKWKSQTQAEGRNIAVRLELDPTPAINGNAAELREAVSNLILNAVDAMPQGGIITLRTRRLQDIVMIEIGDTGVGMSEQVRQRCLEPFFTTKGASATGMGLSTVYGIIERHDGHLDIVSEEGKGTTFFIRLPIREMARGAGVPASGAGDSLSHPLRVLLVEDDPRVRELVSEYLRHDQHEVITAVNGLEGLEMFKAGDFDLVVTDLAVDGLNGERLAEEIKALGPTPVIMLTGFADSLLASGSKPASVDVLLRKPLSPGDLWRAMAQAMKTAA
jgi:signal transduction histidine kinase